MSVLKASRRRTYLKAADRRAQILDVAKKVFTRRGYRDANVSDICSEARIGRGTLYQYFQNKHDVLLTLMSDLSERVAAVLRSRPRIDALPAGTKPSVQLVRGFCQRRLKDLLAAIFIDEPTLRLLLRDGRGHDGTVDRIIAAIEAQVSSGLEADLRAAQKAGYLRRGEIRLIARYILGGIEKLVLTALINDEAIDLEAIVELAVDIELFGILKPEALKREVRK
jgi:AcrR family transcriptional regulator